MQADLNKPDILTVAEREVPDLKKRGAKYVARCPFPDHDDRTPSFMVDPERQSFICFGCNRKGDVIEFVRQLHGLSFPDALKFLGIKPGKPAKFDRGDEIEQQLVSSFRRWERSFYGQLADRFREINQRTRGLKTIEEAETVADLFHELPLVEHRLNILSNGNDDEKVKLFKEVTLERKRRRTS